RFHCLTCKDLSRINFPLLEQNLRQAPLDFAERAPVLERLEDPDRLPEQLLGLRNPAASADQATDTHDRPREVRRGPDLREQVAGATEVGQGFVVTAAEDVELSRLGKGARLGGPRGARLRGG